jgi:hypothetical protein
VSRVTAAAATTVAVTLLALAGRAGADPPAAGKRPAAVSTPPAAATGSKGEVPNGSGVPAGISGPERPHGASAPGTRVGPAGSSTATPAKPPTGAVAPRPIPPPPGRAERGEPQLTVSPSEMAPPRRDPGATRAVEARGEPIVIRLGLQRMTQVQFSTDIQQVVTAFTKQQLSMETAGPRLFLSALEPDISGELFVTLTGGPTLTLVVVPAQGDRDLAVRVISPGAEASARVAETAGLTPLRLMRAMILNLPPPGVSPRAGDGRVVYEDAALRLTLLATWTSPALEGVVLGAENLRALWIMLPLDRLAFPGLLAVHAETESLAPPPTTPEQALAAQHRTRLYLVRTAEGR